jgi:hypothetical protein
MRLRNLLVGVRDIGALIGTPARRHLANQGSKTAEIEATHPDDLAAEVAQVELMHQGKIDSYGVDKRYLRKDGAIVWGRKTVGSVAQERRVDRLLRQCD